MSANGDSNARQKWRNPYVERVAKSPLILQAKTDFLLSDSEQKLLDCAIKNHEGLVIELGSGSGEHIIEQARKSPKVLFVGFEIRYKRLFMTAKKAGVANLSNLLLVQADGRRTFELLKDIEIDGAYINFPDPWDKRRWKKHRMATTGFIATIAKKLKIGGFFSFKTDHREYFEQVVEIVKNVYDLQIFRLTFDLTNSEFNLGNVRTEFEKLFISKGLPIHFIEAKKVGTSSNPSYNSD